jgi:hypothetical protein
MPEIHDTDTPEQVATVPMLSVSVKLSTVEVAVIDAWARKQEIELRAKGLRIAVSRAAAIRSLIMLAAVTGVGLKPSTICDAIDP